MSDHEHNRAIDKWLKYVAIFGPMVSGIVFGAAGYVGGYQHAKEEVVSIGNRTTLLEGWKERQEAFNQQTVASIARLKALMKEPP